MTGKRNVELFTVKIEGTIMNVCKECIKYGERVDKPTSFKTKQRSFSFTNDVEEFVIKNYSQIIKNAREQRGLKQSELADKLNIKESLLHKIESNHLKLSIPLAKKLSRFLNITLLEKAPQSATVHTSFSTSEPLTMEAKLLEAMKKKK